MIILALTSRGAEPEIDITVTIMAGTFFCCKHIKVDNQSGEPFIERFID
jgi:hypothetical protein